MKGRFEIQRGIEGHGGVVEGVNQSHGQGASYMGSFWA